MNLIGSRFHPFAAHLYEPRLLFGELHELGTADPFVSQRELPVELEKRIKREAAAGHGG